MEQNKVRTYLLYAVGEIALVMIGILLALQVNNWNQERLANEGQKVLLNNVLETLKADSTALQSVENIMGRVNNVHTQLYKINKGDIPADSLKNSFVLRRSIPRGVVSIIRYPDLASQVLDARLKVSVLNYYDYLNAWNFVVDNYNDFIENKMRPFLGDQGLMNYGHALQLEGEDISLINDKKLIENLNREVIQQMLIEAAIKSTNTTYFFDMANERRTELKAEIQRVLD
jgi:hypothetical protein